jgi:hypothetical protein
VAGSCEYGDEPSGSCATELVSMGKNATQLTPVCSASAGEFLLQFLNIILTAIAYFGELRHLTLLSVLQSGSR